MSAPSTGFWRDFFATGDPGLPPVGVSRMRYDIATSEIVWVDSNGDSVLPSSPGVVFASPNGEVVTIAEGDSTGTLAATPNGGFFQFSRNGILQVYGTEVTLSGTTVTLGSPAEADDVFVAWYTK